MCSLVSYRRCLAARIVHTWYTTVVRMNMQQYTRYPVLDFRHHRLLIFVFLPQQASLAPLWPLRASTWTTPSSITCRRAFVLFSFFLEESYFSNTEYFVFLGLFLCVNTGWRACCRRASTASTVQHNAISPVRSSKASICRSERDNANKQTEFGESQHIMEHFYSSLCMFSKRTNKSKSAWSTKNIHNHSLPISTRYVLHCSFSPPVRYFPYVHAASGLLSWSMELLAFARRQFAPKIVDVSVRFIRILLYYFLWASVAGGGSRPPSEAPCIYYNRQ